MATFVVCTRCGTTREIAGLDQPLPKLWQRSDSTILCPRCSSVDEEGAVDHVIEEEGIYLNADDTFDEECSICRGPCQGH